MQTEDEIHGVFRYSVNTIRRR